MKLFIPLMLAGLAVSACGGGGSSNGMGSTSPPSSSGPGTGTDMKTLDMSTFAREQVAATSDTTSPVEVENITWVSKDENNPDVFDDLFAAQP